MWFQVFHPEAIALAIIIVRCHLSKHPKKQKTKKKVPFVSASETQIVPFFFLPFRSLFFFLFCLVKHPLSHPMQQSSEQVGGFGLHLAAIARSNAVARKLFAFALTCKLCNKQVPNEMVRDVRAWTEAQNEYTSACPECHTKATFMFRVQFPSVAQHLIYVDLVDFLGPSQTRAMAQHWLARAQPYPTVPPSHLLSQDVISEGSRSILWNVYAHFDNIDNGLAWFAKEEQQQQQQVGGAISQAYEISFLVQVTPSFSPPPAPATDVLSPLVQVQQQQQQQMPLVPVIAKRMLKTWGARRWAEIESSGNTFLQHMQSAPISDAEAGIFHQALADADTIPPPTDSDLCDPNSIYYDHRASGTRYYNHRQDLQNAFVGLTPNLESSQPHQSTSKGVTVNLRAHQAEQTPLAVLKQVQYDLATHHAFRVNLVFLAALLGQRCHMLNNDKRLKFKGAAAAAAAAAADKMPALVKLESAVVAALAKAKQQKRTADADATEDDEDSNKYRRL